MILYNFLLKQEVLTGILRDCLIYNLFRFFQFDWCPKEVLWGLLNSHPTHKTISLAAQLHGKAGRPRNLSKIGGWGRSAAGEGRTKPGRALGPPSVPAASQQAQLQLQNRLGNRICLPAVKTKIFTFLGLDPVLKDDLWRNRRS